MSNFWEKLCYFISHPSTPTIFSVVSIVSIIAGIVGVALNIEILNVSIFYVSFILLLFSVLIIIYQSFRIDIMVYPLTLTYIEVTNGNLRYLGISNKEDTAESTVQFFLSKHSLAPIKLKSLVFSFPPAGQLILISTDFTTELRKYLRGNQTIVSGEPLLINKNISGLSVLECYYRITDTRYFKKSGDNLIITVNYEIKIPFFNFPVYNEKIVKLGYHIE